MKVFLIRHSRAIDEHHGLIDDDRYLSAEGRLRARAVGAVLAREGVGFDAVITSPLARAIQTAEMVCAQVGYQGIIATSRALVHSMPARLAVAELPAQGVNVAVFGHMPHLSDLGALLTGRPGFAHFKPCQVMVIDDGEVRWTVDPDALRVAPMATGASSRTGRVWAGPRFGDRRIRSARGRLQTTAGRMTSGSQGICIPSSCP